MFEDMRPRTAEEHRVGDRAYRKWAVEKMKKRHFRCHLVTDKKGEVAGGGGNLAPRGPAVSGARCPPDALSVFDVHRTEVQAKGDSHACRERSREASVGQRLFLNEPPRLEEGGGKSTRSWNGSGAGKCTLSSSNGSALAFRYCRPRQIRTPGGVITTLSSPSLAMSPPTEVANS